jgi:hypothetical protein
MTFALEEVATQVVLLTVIHDDLEPDSGMLRGVREGSVGIVSDLESLRETGWPLSEEAPRLEVRA